MVVSAASGRARILSNAALSRFACGPLGQALERHFRRLCQASLGSTTGEGLQQTPRLGSIEMLQYLDRSGRS